MAITVVLVILNGVKNLNTIPYSDFRTGNRARGQDFRPFGRGYSEPSRRTQGDMPSSSGVQRNLRRDWPVLTGGSIDEWNSASVDFTGATTRGNQNCSHRLLVLEVGEAAKAMDVSDFSGRLKA